jgi:hypothetical protein
MDILQPECPCTGLCPASCNGRRSANCEVGLTQVKYLRSLQVSILLNSHDGAEVQRALVQGLAEIRHNHDEEHTSVNLPEQTLVRGLVDHDIAGCIPSCLLVRGYRMLFFIRREGWRYVLDGYGNWIINMSASVCLCHTGWELCSRSAGCQGLAYYVVSSTRKYR